MMASAASASVKTAVGETLSRSSFPKYDDTNLFQIVNLVCDFSARDLKNTLAAQGSTTVIEINPKTGSGAPTKVDLVKLCKFLPTHLIAVVCKHGRQHWLDGYISKGMKFLLHLTRLGKKKTGPLDVEINANVKKYVDLCFFAAIAALREACDASDAQQFDMCLEVSRVCILVLDFLMDSELDRSKQPFIDSFISHPKLDTFVTTIIDTVRLILEHRDLFPLKGDRYNAIVTKCLVSIFDAMDIFCMSEDYVEILSEKPAFLPLIECFVQIVQDPKHTQAVVYSSLKLLFRLLEERPALLEMVASTAAASRFQQLVTFVIDTAGNYLETPAKFNDEIRLEAVRITQILADDRQYKRNVLERGTASIIKFFSAHPSLFPDEFKNSRTAAIHFAKTMANLHATTPNAAPTALAARRFVDDIVDAAKLKGGMLLKKAFSNSKMVYVPHFVQNINFILMEIFGTPGMRGEFTKAEVRNLISFRRDIENSLALSSGKQLDSELDKKMKEWESEAPSAQPAPAASPLSAGVANMTVSAKKKTVIAAAAAALDPKEIDKRKGRPPKRKKPGMAPGSPEPPSPGNTAPSLHSATHFPPLPMPGTTSAALSSSTPTSATGTAVTPNGSTMAASLNSSGSSEKDILPPRSGKGGPLDGLTFRIGKSIDTPELQDKITAAGGLILQYTTKHTTHYLSTVEEYDEGGPHILAAIRKPIFIVSPDFVHDCIKEGKRVSEEPYRIDNKI